MLSSRTSKISDGVLKSVAGLFSVGAASIMALFEAEVKLGDCGSKEAIASISSRPGVSLGARGTIWRSSRFAA